ncbi:MAG: serine/threonine-protein kinase [Acidimicrobiales bacterium]|jgi:serine/threonine protein kinase
MTLINETLGGHFQLVRLLGRGGMSDVYEAVDARSSLVVAVKVVRSGDPEFVRRLAHEARALESFEHPGLVRLYDTGLAGDQAYLVMEYVEGITLAESLRRGPLAAKDVAALGVSLADALAYVHERGIVHRDVKPSNILISLGGEVKLGDFGIAQLHDAATLTITGTMLGTVSYMAPEQLEDTQVGPGADIWSLGIVLLECLTGQRVYEGSPSEIVARRLRAPIPLPADLPVPWKLLFSGMLDHRPDQRLSGRDVAALLATSPYVATWSPSTTERDDATYDLTALAPAADITLVAGSAALVAADATQISRPPMRNEPRRRARRPMKTIIGALVALAVIGIGLGFWLVPGPKHDPPPKTTTTTMPSASTALSTLVSDMARAQSAGRMGPAAEQNIANNAEQALANNTAGNITQAGNDLQQAETTIVNGIQGGTIAEAEGLQLLHALSVLSTSLGVSIPPTTTTTTTTSTTTTSTTTTTTTLPGFGGFGPGNGNGNG